VVTDNNPLDVSITLYDYNNDIINISLNDASNVVGWEGPSGYDADPQITNDNLTSCVISKNSEEDTSYAGILKCTINDVEIKQLNNKKIDLISYLPISYSNNLNQYIEGATTVIYDSNGGNP
jgi:hypothetical protein